MSSMKEIISEHLTSLDKNINMEYITGKSLQEWFQPFFDTITDKCEIPYLINTKERFRASPLASTIIALNATNLIPYVVLSKMNKNLLFLRDNNIETDTTTKENTKKAEDIDGWSLGEGVSIWSTSLAIIALLYNVKVDINLIHEYKKTVIWLAHQRSDGFAYQNYSNCEENAIMTALASYALALSIQNKSVFEFTSDEEQTIVNALNQSFVYLESHFKKKYWEFDKNPSCYATVWSLISIREMIMCETPKKSNMVDFYNDVCNKCLKYILSCMPSKIACWESEQIVKEAGAKYSKQKNYHSFSPALILQLLDLGVSAYNPKIVNQIYWLINNTDKWKIEEYDKGNICTFTYVMVLSAIVKWINAIGTENAYLLLRNRNTMGMKIWYFVLGYPYTYNCPELIINKNRFIYITMVMLLVLILYLFRNVGINLLISLFNILYKNGDTIVVNIISNWVYKILGAILTLVIPYLWKKGQ